MTNRYVLQAGPDGQVWVPIQALMEDIKEAAHRLENFTPEWWDTLTPHDREILTLKVKGLDTIYSFLGSLLIEYATSRMNGSQLTQYNLFEQMCEATESLGTHNVYTKQ